MEETKIHVLAEEGCRVWRGKCRSHPEAIEAALRRHASHAVKIGIETGPLTTWLWTELTRRGCRWSASMRGTPSACST
jgi:transposase